MRTIVDRHHIVQALDEVWDALVSVAVDLAYDDWSQPTDCPGWTVKDVYAHVVGTESTLLGRPAPEVELPPDLPHVRNEMGRFNETWVVAYRERSGSELLADLGEVITERRAALATMDQAAFDALTWTPAGEDTYGRYMRIRVMDQWFHEQDVREAIGRPGHLDGLAPQVVLDEITAAIGYLVGKKAALPPGSTARIDLKGPMSHRWDVEVTDIARVVDWLPREPDFTITMPGHTFCRVVGGRRPWDHPWVRSATVVEGDDELATQVLSNLAYVI
ncbi:MAG TPA: maleylpyruvate isomerase family mycothiol-dependent enzyme [Acidimicrobiales bacterium]